MTGEHASPPSGYSGTAAPTQQFGISRSAAGQNPPASTYGSEYPTQQYGGGQSSASGFGSDPGAAPGGYGAAQGQQYGSQPGYGGPPASSGYGSPPAQQPYGAQPGYGAPQQQGYPGQQVPGQGYGTGYPAAPAKKRNTGLIVALSVLAVLILAAAVLLPTVVLAKTVLDPAAVQQDVAAQFKDQEGVGVQLTCPADMEVEVGSTYECTGTTEDSEDVTLVIEISDENGNYTWQERQ
ncbi:MAG: DUF4333 domain-containing protein [Geodermatophilaceae bacterium]|nr:DUF4333 domain-containing protein [Geodermatophilaceae bacterium]